MFCSWKNSLLEDAIRTIKRLNEECSDRTYFEHKLLEQITEYEIILKEYEKRTGVSYQEIYDSIYTKEYSEDMNGKG